MTDHIVDACCVINLHASGRIEPIIKACGGSFYLSKQVRNESLWIRQPDATDATVLIPTPIDLSLTISSGLIKECDFQGAVEFDAYVEFASQIDDGEASCLAIAKSRGWMVATDDRKAMRLANEAGISVITTPEFIDRWVKSARPTREDLAKVLRCIERFAKFQPHTSSPFYEWWIERCDP